MRCPHCNGAKKISELGFMKVTCPTCLGVGYVKDEPAVIAVENTHEAGFDTLEFRPKKSSTSRAKTKIETGIQNTMIGESTDTPFVSGQAI